MSSTGGHGTIITGTQTLGYSVLAVLALMSEVLKVPSTRCAESLTLVIDTVPGGTEVMRFVSGAVTWGHTLTKLIRKIHK